MSPHGLPLQSLGTPTSLLQDFSQMGAHNFDSTGLLLPPHMTEPSTLSSQDDAQWSAAGPSPPMSASAPEFVPLGAQAKTEEAPLAQTSPKAAATTPLNSRKAGRARAPLSELTNIVEASDLLKAFKSPTNKNVASGRGHLPQPENPSESSASSPECADSAGRARPTGLLLDDEASTEEPSPASLFESSPPNSGEAEESKSPEDNEDAAKRVLAEDADDSEGSMEEETSCGSDGDARPDATFGVAGNSVDVDPDSLPSVGSALHWAGECKRCNFYPKGRCQNGKNCSFCHFNHDKRKPSRQEKRERRAAYMDYVNAEVVEVSASQVEAAQQLQQVMHHPPGAFMSKRGPFAVYDEDLYNDETLAYSIFPGLPPILATKLPAPLPLPGTMDTMGQTNPALPPGLAPPQRMVQPWQPEAEASPAAHSVLATGPMTGMDRLLQQVVSSTPLTSAPLSTAPTPIATPTATPSAALSTEARCFTQTKTTSGTQTNADYMCQQCEEDGKAKATGDGSQWSRDELLRLRSTGSSAEAPQSKAWFHTMPISACGDI